MSISKLWICSTLILLSIYIATCAKQPVQSKKSKLCGNVACDEVLFKSRVTRVMGVNSDPTFLKLADNAIIDVFAFKFSDRPDIMEGMMQDGTRGFFYAGAIDKMPFAEFLRSAIEIKKEVQVISQDNADIGEKRIIGVLHAEQDLVRDYNAKAAQAAAEAGLPAPTPMQIPEPVNNHGHGHSHSHGHGHGHSHSHGHGHSHDHGDSHSAPATAPTATTPPPTPPTASVEVPPPTPAPTPVQEPVAAAAEINLNNVLGSPPTIAATPEPEANSVTNEIPKNPNEPGSAAKTLSMEEEIELLIKREEAMLTGMGAGAGENSVVEDPNPVETQQAQPAEAVNVVSQEPEVTQPPLELRSLTPEEVKAMETQATTEVPVAGLPEVPVQVPVETETLKVAEEPATTTTPAPVAAAVVEDVTLPPLSATLTPEPASVPAPEVEVTSVAPAVVAADPVVAEESTTPTPLSAFEQPPFEQVTPAPVTESLPVAENVATVTQIPPFEEAPKGSCFKDGCDELQKEEEQVEKKSESLDTADRLAAQKSYEDAYGQFKDLNVDKNYSNETPRGPTVSSGVADFIRSTFGLGDVSDASIGLYLNITFVAASVLLFVIVQAMSSTSDPVQFNMREYYELTTKYKELELKLKAKSTEIQQLQSNGQRSSVNDQEVVTLRHQLQSLQSVQDELLTANAQKADLEHQCRQWNEAYNGSQAEVERLGAVVRDFEERLERASSGGHATARELDGLKANLTEAQQTLLQREQEIVTYKNEKNEVQQKLSEANAEIRKRDEKLEELDEQVCRLEADLKESKIENASLAVAIQQFEEKNQNEGNEGSAAESGGSGGWSDFGDDFDGQQQSEEKTPEASQSGGGPSAAEKELAEIRARYKKYGDEVEELSKLKEKLQEVEVELNKYKSLYEAEEKAKVERENKLKALETDMGENAKKLEWLETEKKESADRIKELLSLLTKNMDKSGEADKLVSDLREEVYNKDKRLREVELESRDKDDKIREIELELKRKLSDYAKLETRSFHDVMQLKKKLDDYQTAQLLASTNASRSPFHSPEEDRRAGMSSPLDDPIWDEPDLRRSGPSLQQDEHYFSSGSNTLPLKKRNSRRSDHRLMMGGAAFGGAGGENSPSDRDDTSKSKKDIHRRRSRSHGRQPPMYVDPYGPPMGYMGAGSADASYMSQQQTGFAPLSGRHSKSGHLHYSSGGSNGGRSPPPEMPLLSAVPPPGVRKMPSKRLDSSLHGK